MVIPRPLFCLCGVRGDILVSSLANYYQKAGRDDYIERYRAYRVSLLRTVEEKTLKNKNTFLSDIEKALNLLFYPEKTVL